MITIDYNVCNLCSGAKEKRCERICPGDLITTGVDGRPLVRPVEDCWGCTACVKDCPVAAISLRLPSQVQPSSPSLRASVKGKDTLWALTDVHGNKEEFVIEVVRDTKGEDG
jgi:adenylylsulfate reductase subunit B